MRICKKLKRIAKAKLADRKIALSLAIGFTVGWWMSCFLVCLGYLKLDTTLSFSTLFQTAATVGSALFIWLFLKGVVDSDQREKSLVAAELENIVEFLGAFENLSSDDTYKDVVALIKKMGLKTSFLEQTSKDYEFSAEIRSRIDDLSKQVAELRKLATAISTGDNSFVVIDEKFKWSTDHQIEIDIAVEGIRRTIFRTIFESSRRL